MNIRSRQVQRRVYFSEVFEVSPQALESYGAYNVSLAADLPLFIDPFLLFASDNPIYQSLHKDIIRYMLVLKEMTSAGLDQGNLDLYFHFPEIKQNWLGFSKIGNSGKGLGTEFASSLAYSLSIIFKDFGEEKITNSSHIEKLCLGEKGIGRDMISDFTTNLILDFLLTYTQIFVRRYLQAHQFASVRIAKAVFDFESKRWLPKTYDLPVHERFDGKRDYVILTPKDILTQDKTWINQHDLYQNSFDIPQTIKNISYRSKIEGFIRDEMQKSLSNPDERKTPRTLRIEAFKKALKMFPDLYDYYIFRKEQEADKAKATSRERVEQTQHVYFDVMQELLTLLDGHSRYFDLDNTSEQESRRKILEFKHVIEDRGGYKLFFDSNCKRKLDERDAHRLFDLLWHGSIQVSKILKEVDDGQGSVDFVITKGSKDTTIIEWKLASSSQLKRNLKNQTGAYSRATQSQAALKVVILFSDTDERKLKKVLKELGMEGDADLYIVDARCEGRTSASKI